MQLPLVRIDVEGCRTFDNYLAGIGRKRRHHLRQERKLFAEAGARVEVLAPPIKAYPNLIHAALEYAIESGYREVTLGPLNNEAKRRAGP
jgi:hypothetical protein